jgi:TnpA family transposase
MRLGFKEVRCVGSESDDRMACPLWRSGCDDLLACRAQIHLHLLATENLSSSEVAAMIEGVLRHCTEMSIDRQYVDSHGQSEVGFAFCRLLGFQLLPRLKVFIVRSSAAPKPAERNGIRICA